MTEGYHLTFERFPLQGFDKTGNHRVSYGSRTVYDWHVFCKQLTVLILVTIELVICNRDTILRRKTKYIFSLLRRFFITVKVSNMNGWKNIVNLLLLITFSLYYKYLKIIYQEQNIIRELREPYLLSKREPSKKTLGHFLFSVDKIKTWHKEWRQVSC